MITFEWDEKKNIQNIKKHGVSFATASSVFYDEYAILLADEPHSSEEERFILIGYSEYADILVVCHCYRKEDTIRIFSARKATKRETEQYNERID